MREVLGVYPDKKPQGMLRAVRFPSLATMDAKTGDGRILDSGGKGARELPRTIYMQIEQQPGHFGSVPVGALHEITFGEDGNVGGRGWLIDDDNGRAAVRYIETSTLRHNSVDLAEVAVRFEWEDGDDDISLRFTKWKIAATTLVGKPAFADARAELVDEDLVASWYEDDRPLVIGVESTYEFHVAADELVADGERLAPWDAFHVPEADTPTKLTVGAPDENGWIWVSGHLSLWESCHDGVAGRCTRTPRPRDGYASFNKPGVLTDRGQIETGPIFLAGGHKRAPDGDYASAYGGVENSWADVRVIPGKLGPWMSGVVRPGVPEEKVYAARASRVSGHWLGDRLKAIVSVNAEGFDVPGSGKVQSDFQVFLDDDGRVTELVASLPHCLDEPDEPDDDLTADGEGGEVDPAVLAQQIAVELDLEHDE